jgi:(2R)-3-sulfolactate dehydrogenase (NADP+)
MSTTILLSTQQIETLALRALTSAGAPQGQAEALAASVAAAEADGIASHGLAYVPVYCEHLRCGKVNKAAEPSVKVLGSVVRVDADAGFAHLPIQLGFEQLVPLARQLGAAVMAVSNSYNCGVLAYHTETLAKQGLVALGFTNAPASIAPWGGIKPVLGTNPWSLAVPDGAGGAHFVIDQSSSVIAKSEVIKHRRENRPLPNGWALDRDGQPTTSAEAALDGGTMAPAAGYKGVGNALLVEIFAACLSGATPGVSAAPFSGTAGGPPRTGQFFIAIDPEATSGGAFDARLQLVLAAFAGESDARLPGARRRAARERHRDGAIEVNPVIHDTVAALAEAF